MSKIMLTGSQGFIGQHAFKELLGDVYPCLEELTTQLTSVEPDTEYVVNLASRSSVADSIKNPVAHMGNNIMLIINLLEMARHLSKLKAFIHFSTVEVFSSDNPYAASKASQDAIATAYQNTYGVPVILVTSQNVIGEGQRDDKFVPTLIRRIQSGDVVDIFVDEGKHGFRTYNPIANVISALNFILDLEPPTSLVRYDISGGEELTNLEMAQKVASRLKQHLNYREVEAHTVRTGYTRHLIADGIDLQELGWTPPQTLDEGLAWIK